MKNLLTLAILLLSSPLYAADHYVSNTGTGTWNQSTSINTPTDIATAFYNATAGDTVYLRGGTYTLSTFINQYANGGNSGTALAPITYTAYTGETPILDGTNCIVQSGGVNSNGAMIMLEKDYLIIDGLTFQNFETAILFSKEGNSSPSHNKVRNCTSTQARASDNSAFVYVNGGTDSIVDLEIYNNDIGGFYTGTGHEGLQSNGAGIIGFGKIGFNIHNNYIHGHRGKGVYLKHASANISPNGNVTSCLATDHSGTIIEKNYFKNCQQFSMSINGTGVTISNNITTSDCGAISIRQNEGWYCGVDITVNHNTLCGYGGMYSIASAIVDNYESDTALQANVFTDNIYATTLEHNSSGTNSLTADYNLFPTGTNVQVGSGGSRTLVNWRSFLGGTNETHSTQGTPTFTGGATPSTILGYALTSDSAGYRACADGSDMGADVSLVGPNAEDPAPAPPTLSNVTISGGSFR